MPAFKLSPIALALTALCVLTGGAALLHTDASRAADQPAAAQPRPAPFYLRGADAAPPADPPPVILP